MAASSCDSKYGNISKNPKGEINLNKIEILFDIMHGIWSRGETAHGDLNEIRALSEWIQIKNTHGKTT